MPEDLIKRDDAVKALVFLTRYNTAEEIQNRCKTNPGGAGWIHGINDAIDIIRHIPSASVEPVRRIDPLLSLWVVSRDESGQEVLTDLIAKDEMEDADA